MKMLICTQVVDERDPVLGFFHRWIEELARHSEQVTVICLREGEHHLPQNVRVLSLGKEGGVSRIKYITRFYRYIWQERQNYDSVFVHMNQVYVLLGGLLWRLWGKRIGLWYVHRSVTPDLYLAVALVYHVFTTSPESFRINTHKRHCIGHGIDMQQFARVERVPSDTLRIITTGRVSATKRIKEMVAAAVLLTARGVNTHLTVVGAPATAADESYLRHLKSESENSTLFTGAVLHEKLPELLAQADVFLNLSATESMDKAVLEALATGMPVVTSNPAFREMLLPYGLFLEQLNTELVAETLVRAQTTNISPLVAQIRSDHSLTGLVSKILGILSA